MYTGVVLLIAVAILVYFGFAHRALDRLRLNDRAALIFLAAMIAGGFLPDISLGEFTAINIGGGLIPLILVGYLYSKARKEEITRSVFAVAVTAVIVYAALKAIPLEPTYGFFIDPLYLIAIVAGVAGYLSGRSRRGAFIAGTLSIIITDIVAQVENILGGVTGNIVIGGAGVFDAVIIAGLLALGLSEVIGESRERIALQARDYEEKEEFEETNPEERN